MEIEMNQTEMNTQEEEKIHLSETSEKEMKRSILYLRVGFYSAVGLAIYFVGVCIYGVIVAPTAVAVYIGLGLWVPDLLYSVLYIIAIVKMHAYIEAYRKLKANKTQQTLEALLGTQKSYYGFLYILTAIYVAGILWDMV